MSYTTKLILLGLCLVAIVVLFLLIWLKQHKLKDWQIVALLFALIGGGGALMYHFIWLA